MGDFVPRNYDREDIDRSGEEETCRRCDGTMEDPGSILPCIECNGTGVRKYGPKVSV